MIINTGMRTDIPAFYSEWFMNRIREGYVLVRNPYYPDTVTRYSLDPKVVDVIEYCTKNPGPMLQYLDELSRFDQYWFVTITPYGKDIEPNVPDVDDVIDAFKELSDKVGKKCVAWRYDPILITGDYDMDFHKESFKRMSEELKGYTEDVIFSFVDLYEKVKRNFPEAKPPDQQERIEIAKYISSVSKEAGMRAHTCFEGTDLEQYGIDVAGCITKDTLERFMGRSLRIPKVKGPRPGCDCVLGNDIGAYNTCGHLCRYCYANSDARKVKENMLLHDPESPLLLGHLKDDEKIIDAKQRSFTNGQTLLM